MKWEYRTETVDESGMYKSGNEQVAKDEQFPDGWINKWESMNVLGEQGWELVSIGFFRDSEATAYFKRPVDTSGINHIKE